MDKLSELTARMEIERSLKRYARSVDRRDYDTLLLCFHPDATDEHGDFCGHISGFIPWVKKRHENIPFSMHSISNIYIEFLDDKTAVVETYFIAHQRRPAPASDGGNGELDIQTIGRYLDRFELRDGEWRVARRRVVYDSSRVTPSTYTLPKIGVLGQRDERDSSVALFKTGNFAD